MTKPIQKQRTFTRKNFAEHNYNCVNRPQTSKFFRPNTQNHLFSQKQKFQQPTTVSVNFHDYPRIAQDHSENYPFFQQSKNNEQNQSKRKTPYYTSIIYHQMMMITTNQIFLNHIHKNTV